MALKCVSVTEARSNFSDLLDEAVDGVGTMIIRNSREAAALIPAHLARFMPLVEAVLCDLGASSSSPMTPKSWKPTAVALPIWSVRTSHGTRSDGLRWLASGADDPRNLLRPIPRRKRRGKFVSASCGQQTSSS